MMARLKILHGKTFCSLYLAMALGGTPLAYAQSVDYGGLSEIYGEPVTTSANGSPQRQSEVPLSMEILTAEEIDRTGARTIPEALRFIPGLSVRRHSFGQYEVSIRGYNQNNAERLLVLVNGRQVYTDYFGQVVWDNIPVEMSEIKQIEVVKGPNTALFGFNAASGVVNIITVNPLYDDLQEAETRIGIHDFQEGTGVLTHKITENVTFKLSGGAYQADDPFEATPDVRDDASRASVALDVWAQVSDFTQMQFEVTHNKHDRNEYLITEGLEAHANYESSSARWRTLMDSHIGLLEFDIYHNETEADYLLDTGPGTDTVMPDNRITVAKLSDTFSLGKSHIFRLAGEHRRASNIFDPLDGDDLQYKIWSGSGLWDWRVNSKLRTSAAVRFDSFELEPDGGSNIAEFATIFPGVTPFTAEDFSQRREEFSYNLGAVYSVTDKDTIRGSVSRGADLPSFTEFGLQFLLPPTVLLSPSGNTDGVAVLGDPNVDTSIVHNYEVGYDRKIDRIGGQFSSTLFYQTNEDMQGFGSSFSTTPNYFGPGLDLERSFLGNVGDSEMYGFEVGLEGNFRQKWDWFANYTFVHVDDDLRNQQNDAPFSAFLDYEDSNIEHTFNAHIGYGEENWRFDLFGQYTSSAEGLVPEVNESNVFLQEDINDQVIVNANVSYDLTDKITWSASGTSLLGKTQQFSQNDAEATVWSSIKFKF